MPINQKTLMLPCLKTWNLIGNSPYHLLNFAQECSMLCSVFLPPPPCPPPPPPFFLSYFPNQLAEVNLPCLVCETKKLNPDLTLKWVLILWLVSLRRKNRAEKCKSYQWKFWATRIQINYRQQDFSWFFVASYTK